MRILWGWFTTQPHAFLQVLSPGARHRMNLLRQTKDLSVMQGTAPARESPASLAFLACLVRVLHDLSILTLCPYPRLSLKLPLYLGVGSL